jgi:hypothetical protein
MAGDEGQIDRKASYTENEFKEFGLALIYDMFTSSTFESIVIDETVFITKGLRSPISITYNPEEEFIKFASSHLVNQDIEVIEIFDFANCLNIEYSETIFIEFKEGIPFRLHMKFISHVIDVIRVSEIIHTAGFFASAVQSIREVGIENGFLIGSSDAQIIEFPR